MTIREPIELDVSGDIEAYTKAVAKIPGVTEKQARAAGIKFAGEMKKGQIKAALESEKAARKAAKSWDEEFKTATKGISMGFGAVFAGVAAAGAAAAEINEARTEMINLSEATGIALDTLAGVEAAANRAGVPVDQVIGGFEDFGEVLFDFSQGGGRAVEALEMLGFRSDEMDAAMSDVDGTLRTVIGRMSKMEEGSKKNAAAQQLFGDAGNRVNAILKDGTLEDYIALAETYGTVIDEDAVRSTKEWNKAVADLGGVLKGTGTEIVDWLDLANGIKGTTALFIFAKTIIAGVAEEYVANVKQIGVAIEALSSGDILGFMSNFADATLLGVGEMKGLIHEAANAVLAFDKETAALDESTGAKKRTKTATKELSAAEEDAAKARAAEAKARDAANKAAEAQLQAIITSQQSLSDITRTALEDQRSGVELINLALVDQLLAIDEIEETLGASSATQFARDEVRARAARDLQALQLEQLAELDEAMAEAADAELERRAQVRAAIQENIAVALEGFRNMSFAADAFMSIRMDQIAEVGRAQRNVVDERISQTEAAEERLREADSETERARALQNLRELAAAEAKSQEILAIQQAESNKLFRARQKLEIANIVISGASAAIAALGPPPVGAGPILGGALAATVVAATAGQIALVQAQTPPQFDAGFASFTEGPDNFAATLRTGESVLNQAATDAMGGAGAVNDLNQGAGGGGFGGGEVVLEMNGREVGRAFVDEMGAGRELDRAMTKRIGRRAGVRPVYNAR